jgi:hypothetical protein
MSQKGKGATKKSARPEQPHSDMAEQGVIGSIFQSAGKVIPECVEKIRPEFFFIPMFRTLYVELCDVWESGKPIDLLTFTQRLRDKKILESVGGVADVTKLASDYVPTAANVEYYLDIVRDKYIARETIATFNEGVRRAYEVTADDEGGTAALLDEVQSRIASIRSLHGRDGDTLTILTPDEISALSQIPNACLLDDNVIQKGGGTVVAGPPGIGKTKLALQFIVAKNTGRQWCGLETHGPPMDWLYLQNENGRDRLERDLQALRKWAPDFDQSKLHIQVYQTDNDGFLCLDDREAVARIARTIQKFNPEGIVADPLRDFGVGDLDSDADMIATVRALAKIVRAGNPHRVLIPIHHALTGRAGALKASGLERSGFARNSKALLGWARAQINIFPGSKESNEILLISCGKNNDGREFPRVAVRLNPDSMIYEVDDGFDFEAWDEDLAAAGKKKKPPTFSVEMVRELVKFSGQLDISGLAALIQKKLGCGRSRSYELVHEGRKAGIFRFHRITELYEHA